MTKLTFKNLFTVMLLSGFCCLVTAQNKENAIKTKRIAAEATAAEVELSFRDLQSLEQAFIDTAPADRKDALVVGQLSDDGRNKDMIVKLAKEIAESKHGRYDSLLIAHKDKLLFESYYLRGRINLPHPQASAVKAYTSLTLGRVIQMGYLTLADLDKPLVSFLKDLNPTKFVDGAEKITLHKALTMHGGLSVDPEKWKALEQNPVALQGQGLVQTLLEHSGPITKESQTYLYGNFNPILVMAVIDAVVPGTAQDFIKNELLDKLSITNYSWETHVSGLPQAGWKVSIMSRDMLKLGSVVLNKGKWKGEQIISADYLAKATRGLVKPTEDWMPDSYRYGYFWYQTPIAVGDKNYNATFAWGGGGQRVIVIDELDLTIVITGHDRDDKIMDQISDAVLPTFDKLNATPLVFATPPAFVEQYAAEMEHSGSPLPLKKPATTRGQVDESEPLKLTSDFANQKALLHKVFFEGESPDAFLQLIAHPEKAHRVKAALALSEINIEFTHNEESGFPEKRRQFWVDVKKHLPNIQNALYEALITSAEEGTSNHIPYTLAWMPGQGDETVELLAWAAEHHPDPWVRRFSVFFVVAHGQNEELAGPLLQSRTHDPDYRVRKEVSNQRIQRLKD